MSITPTEKGTPSRSNLLIRSVYSRRGVGVVPAPPVAERESRQYRGRPGHRVQRADGGAIIAAVAEEVQVGPGTVAGRDPAVVVQDQGAGVVQHRVAPAGDDTRFQRHRAVGVVQGARGSAQVVHRLAESPDAAVAADVAADLNAQPAGAEGPAVVHQVHAVGEDFQVVRAVDHPVLRHREVADHREGTGPILEPAVLGVLQAQQSVGEHGDPERLALHDRRRVGDWTSVQAMAGIHVDLPLKRLTPGTVRPTLASPD